MAVTTIAAVTVAFLSPFFSFEVSKGLCSRLFYVCSLLHPYEFAVNSVFFRQDLLRPFLLACNHADASPHLMIMAMGSIQYLINRDAILPSDAPNILR